MPYSEKNNLLFIHIPKCAGKSFEVAMGIATEQEVKKYKWRSTVNLLGKAILKVTRDKKAMPRLWGMGDISLTLQHVTYTEIELLNLLPQTKLDSAIKVAVVRNPYDRAVSTYKHMGEGYADFKDFVSNYYNSPSKRHNELAFKRTQLDYLRDSKGRVVVDNIIRLENFQADFDAFTAQHGLSHKPLQHIGKQKGKSSYRDYFCTETKRMVENLFGEDIQYFNYNF